MSPPEARRDTEKRGTASPSNAKSPFKGGFGYHPVTAWCDNTGKALTGLLRAGNAGANTAADQIRVSNLALAQIPDEPRYGTPILVSADGAGCSRAWLAHLRRLRVEQGLNLRFSVGFTMTRQCRTPSWHCPRSRGHRRSRPTAASATVPTSPN